MALLRPALLALANNPTLRTRAMRAPFVRRSVSRFMPGEHLEDALAAAGHLADSNIQTMLTRLGENVSEAADAERVTEHYLYALDEIVRRRLPSHLSVKP